MPLEIKERKSSKKLRVSTEEEKMFGKWLKTLLKKDSHIHTEIEKNKKRSFRLLWIIRINAAARLHGITYGKLISNLKSKKVNLDRKVLSDIAMNHPDTFSKIVNKVK